VHFLQRDKIIITHDDYLTLIEYSKIHSVTYGINSKSPLMQLPEFDITRCLPFDIMHTIYEGVARYHIIRLLHYIINSCQYITLLQLNHIITSHHHGYLESDTKPNTINKDSTNEFSYKIKSSGLDILQYFKLYILYASSQMMTLVRFLPFMIGCHIPQGGEHWECFFC